MSRITQALGLLLAAVAFVGCDTKPGDATSTGATTQSGGGGGGGKRIAVIPKATSHEFWKSVQRGAEAAGSERGATIIWKGPVQESERAAQVQMVEQFATEGVDAIALAPLDRAALVRPVAQAAAKGIPVVIFDSALDGEAGKDFVSFVATDNKEGGRMAGRELVRRLNGKGNVVMMRYAEGHASTGEREAGFMEIVKATPGIVMLVENRYGGATVAESQNTALNLVDQIKQADAVFTPNESSTFGMLQALRQSGLAGQKIFVGFDTSTALIDALKKGEVAALVAQNPQKMGREAVNAALDKIEGKTVPARVDSGAALITKENLESPEVQTILGGK